MQPDLNRFPFPVLKFVVLVGFGLVSSTTNSQQGALDKFGASKSLENRTAEKKPPGDNLYPGVDPPPVFPKGSPDPRLFKNRKLGLVNDGGSPKTNEILANGLWLKRRGGADYPVVDPPPPPVPLPPSGIPNYLKNFREALGR